MVKVGDRIRLSSTKGPDRDGVVTAVTGSLLRVRWPSEEETTVAPAPGTLTVLAATDDREGDGPHEEGRPQEVSHGDQDHLRQEGDARQHPVANEGGQTTIALINAPRGMRRRSLGRRPLSSTRAPEPRREGEPSLRSAVSTSTRNSGER